MAIETAESRIMVQALLQARFPFLDSPVLAAVDDAFNAQLEIHSEGFAAKIIAALICADRLGIWASEPPKPEWAIEMVNDGLRYEAELQALDFHSLRRAYDELATERGHRRDQHEFFSHPRHKPDFDLWNKKSRWTVEEAVALSLDKEPTAVNLQSLSETPTTSLFKKEYELRLDILRRKLGQKANDLLPATEFVALLKPDFSVPLNFGHKTVSAKPSFQMEELETELHRLRHENATLKSEIAQLKMQPEEFDKRGSMRKLIYCIAVNKFKWGPGRNTSTRLIEDCIRQVADKQQRPALIVSTNTIKNILDGAAAAVNDKAPSE